MRNRCIIAMRIEVACGLVSEVYTDDEQDAIIRIIHAELAPLVLGADAGDPERLWAAMAATTRDILRDRKLALQAMACIDAAAWDILAKSMDRPVRHLWGSTSCAIPVVVIGGYYDVPNPEIGALMASYAALGVTGCKFKVGGTSLEADAERVTLARAGAPDDFVLMVDANQGYSLADALRFAERIRDLDIRWFEEPCRWENDRRWLRDVRQLAGIPTCAGQSEHSLAGIRDLIMDGAIDVSNFDSSWSRGPTVWSNAASVSAAFGVEVGHHEEAQVAGRLLAAAQGATYLECFDPQRDPLFWAIQAARPTIEGVRYILPDGPNFGIQLDWDYVAPAQSGHARSAL